MKVSLQYDSILTQVLGEVRNAWLVIKSVRSAATGITTGVLLNSAQLVYMLEFVAGSHISAVQPVLSAA